nr:zinc finger BED domain-containing protein RICESLEEPER 1-like [Tanacetum cinerariifolium]
MSPSSENRDAFVDDIPTTQQAQEKETKNDGENEKGEQRNGKELMNLKSTTWDHFTMDAPNLNTGDSSSTFITWSFNQEISRKYCARIIIPNEFPFKTIEHEGFQNFVNMLQPQF